MRALPTTQLMVSVLLQLEQVPAVQVVVPNHEPDPPVPKYWPQMPLVARPRDAFARCARERPSRTEESTRGGPVVLARLPARRRGSENAHGRWSRSINAIKGCMSGGPVGRVATQVPVVGKACIGIA